MGEPRVVVTFHTPSPQREVLDEVLAGVASPIYLDEVAVAEREQVLRQADVLLSWNLPRELRPDDYALLTRVGLVQLISAGADQVPLTTLPAGLRVASNAGAYAEPMAEHVLAMVLALAKRLVPAHQKLRAGEWDQFTRSRRLAGMTAGILGFGGIGKAAARLMRAFGMRILAVNTSGTTSEPVELVGTLQDLDTVLAQSDVVLVSLPLTPATRGLIGRDQLERMKPDAILVNVARGPILDEAAIYAHAASHPSFLVGIDAWWVEPFSHGCFQMDHPFLELPNVLGSPHNSAVVPGSLVEGARRAAENVCRFLRGEPVTGLVRSGGSPA